MNGIIIANIYFVLDVSQFFEKWVNFVFAADQEQIIIRQHQHLFFYIRVFLPAKDATDGSCLERLFVPQESLNILFRSLSLSLSWLLFCLYPLTCPLEENTIS